MPAKKTAAPQVDPNPELGPPSDEDFTFQSSRGPLTVCSLNKGPVPNQFKIKKLEAKGDRIAMMMAVTEVKVSPEVFDELLELTNEELGQFHLEWAQHSGLMPEK